MDIFLDLLFQLMGPTLYMLGLIFVQYTCNKLEIAHIEVHYL